MYRRYYKETPPGYSGVAFTREEPRDAALGTLSEDLPRENAPLEAVSYEDAPSEDAPLEAVPSEAAPCDGGTAETYEKAAPAVSGMAMGVVDPRHETALPPAFFSCTKKSDGSVRASGAQERTADRQSAEAFAGRKEAPLAKGEEGAVQASAPDVAQETVPLFKRAFTLEDILLAAVALMLISGEVEEESLLLLGLVLVLLGK